MPRNILSASLIILAVLATCGCSSGRPKALIREFQGSHIAGRSDNHLHFGARIQVDGAGTPTAQLWHFDGTRRIHHEAVILTEFELQNLYSSNYGSLRPVWRYVYRNPHGIVIAFNEYGNGAIEPQIVFEDQSRWIERSMIDALPEQTTLVPEPTEFEPSDLVMSRSQDLLLSALAEGYATPKGATRIRDDLSLGYLESEGTVDFSREFARTVGRYHMEHGQTIDLLPVTDGNGNEIQIQLYDTVVTKSGQDSLFLSVTAKDPAKKYEEHGESLAFTAKLMDVRRRRADDGSEFLLRMALVHPPRTERP